MPRQRRPKSTPRPRNRSGKTTNRGVPDGTGPRARLTPENCPVVTYRKKRR